MLHAVEGSARKPRGALNFLQGGGEMGALMRAKDWSQTSLGPPEGWPPPLRAMVRILLNTGHPMYIWWGKDGACLYNDAYRQSIGPERHPGSLGCPAKDVWAEIWPIIGPQIEQVREGRGATWNVNHLVPITRNGRLEDVYWTYSYSPIDDESAPNGIGGVLVVCTETTEQVLTAKRLAEERDRLGALFEQAPGFMALLSGPEHRFEIVNPEYRALVQGRDVLGKSVAEALPEAVEQGYTRLLDEVYASGKAYRANGATIRFQSAAEGEPSERYVDFVYQPIRGDDGSVNGIFVQGADVTDRVLTDAALRASEARYRDLAQELAASNRMKDEFLATLAHELRNPLAPIRAALEVQRQVPDNERLRATTGAIMTRQVAHMSRLIDDLLDVSRVTRGAIELRHTAVVLAEVVAGALETSMPMLEQKSHHCELDIAETPLTVRGDAVRLIQVVSNLLNNAAKFTPPGGEIRLSLAQEHGRGVIRVKDSGAGIPAEMRDRIFEMFVQVRAPGSSAMGGLGIGLCLVKQLVEMHEGTVEVRSAGEGQGSEFIVSLPLEH